MYLPYLRGKQFELLALRETVALLSANRHNVSPIIEPVKSSTSTLEKAVRELAIKEINFNVILNPSVGDLCTNNDLILNALRGSLRGYENYQIAFLINSDQSWRQIDSILKKVDFEHGGISLIHNCQFNDISDRIDRIPNVKYHIVNYNTTRRYHRSFPAGTKISLDDYFKSQLKNADYSKNVDEAYTDEHLYFSDEGFHGFSDYLTLGVAYQEGGFLPYAVAIHLTYPEAGSGAIRIRHFVCDSVDDNSDVPGKFREALEKLISWVRREGLTSSAIEEFEELYDSGHFPGLGVVKKLSIKHHIELVLSLI